MDQLKEQFKQAMRRLAATVNVITLSDGASFKGMTATAVCSLSVDPPSLLVCVNQSATLHNPLLLTSHFCVNVLHHEQIDVAKRFSDSSMRDVRFEGADWQRHDMGPPVLSNAQVAMICERVQLVTFATHTIVIGTVVDIHNRADIDPLLYVNGSFTSAAQ